jgi:two-component system CheB/CheR fusion protein
VAVKKITKSSAGLYIAAIGASAGGLEALQKLISHIPADIENVAFIVVRHLSPAYKSLLAQTLSSQTKLEVVEVKNKVKVAERHIYITPPDCQITIKKGVLLLNKSANNRTPNPSVNVLFESLAADLGQKAIGVILSGTGSDGADGIVAIKRAGGITMVQNPKSAKYNGMPNAAIATDKADHIFTPDKIAEQIGLLTSNDKRKLVRYSAEEIRNRPYEEVIERLSHETGTDFTNYKRNTLYRRIEKRISELKLDTAPKYLKYIDKNHGEIEDLFANVLIGVTSFFREPAVFKALEKQITALVDSKPDNASLRVWVPGCATGEEVYTVGMIVADILKKKKRVLPVQIFGTDIDEHALNVARKAVYPTKTLQQVPADKAKEYFIRHNGTAELSKTIRSMVLFSKHDLTHNPPFLKLDLIVCRNLLIYFNNKLQDYVFPVFFSALNPHGYLLLGKSEGIGHFSDLFTTLNREAKIYQRKGGNPLHNIRYTPLKVKEADKHKPPYQVSMNDMVRETIFKIYEHPYVVINDNADIKEINGDVGLYLGLRQRQMNANLYKLAHEDLKIELRSLVNKCTKENKDIKGSVRKLKTRGREYAVQIMIRPLLHLESPNEFYLVVFREVKNEVTTKAKPLGKGSSESAERIKELEMELNATKEDLQNFVERLENANTEMQTVNEELQSSNEELKISNEELETANEELQSSNEEINIAYAELKSSNIALEKQEKQLRQSEANTQALLSNTMQAFVLIGRDYSVLAFNEQAVKVFNEISGIGISEGADFQKLISRKEFAAFVIDFQNALKGKIISAERTLVDKKQNIKTFSFNFTPVTDDDGAIECISFGMIDITELSKTKTELNNSEKLLKSVFDTADVGLAIVDAAGKIVKMNEGLSSLMGYGYDELNGKSWFSLAAPENLKIAKTLHKEILAGKSINGKRKAICKDGTIIDVYATNKLLKNADGSVYVIKTLRDITESKRAKELLTQAEIIAGVGGFEIDPYTKKVYFTKEMLNIFELEEDFEPSMEWIYEIYNKDHQASVYTNLNDAIVKGKKFDVIREFKSAKNNSKWLHILCNPIEVKPNMYKVIGTAQDITSQKYAEEEIERLSRVASHTNSSVSITDDHGKILWVNKSFENLTGYKLDEIVGKNSNELLQGIDTDPAMVKQISAKLKKHQASTGAVILYYTKAGEPVWISTDITPIFKDGKLINFIGIMTDLTDIMKAQEVEQAQEALLQKQELFNAIATYFPNGILGVIDQNLRYIFVGGTELHRLGLDHQGIIGDRIFDKIHPESNDQAEPFLKQVFQGEKVSFELTIDDMAYKVVAVPINGETDEKIPQALVVIHNITEQKKIEEGLMKVIDKQKELTEMKSKFVSIASHEFRTPLSTILSSSSLVEKYKKPEDEPKREKHLARIKTSVHNLTDILNDFLILGKMEEGGVKNNPAVFDIRLFFKELTDEMQGNLKEGQEIKLTQHHDSPLVYLDSKHFKNVLLNLLSNAIKYSPEGKTIHLSCNFKKGHLIVKVRDEGMGIPKEDQEHLFTTFFRANNVTNIQGTGMGLHIVKKYMELMGGNVSFESELDKGTVFTLDLPHATQG